MTRDELEALLHELDEELVKAFPDSEPISVLMVGGACLLFSDVTVRPTADIDVIITDLMGTGEASLVYDLTPTTARIRKLIEGIGKRHGLRGDDRMFLNDDCAAFLLEMSRGKLPPSRLLRTYRKLHLSVPVDLSYILACKFMAGRPAKDYQDIAVLCKLLDIQTRKQAHELVTRFFSDPYQLYLHRLADTLKELFPEG